MMYARWTVERAEQEIIRLCHSGLDSHSLWLAVFNQLQCVMPYEAFWCATTDPSTLLFTSAVTAGFGSETIPQYVTNELLQEDYNKFTDLAKGRSPVNTLQIATRGDLTRSQRYREILAPSGLGNEMRAVFRTGGSTWGAMCLHRLKRHEDFTPEHVAFFATIAPHLATGIRAATGHLWQHLRASPLTSGRPPSPLAIRRHETCPAARYALLSA